MVTVPERFEATITSLENTKDLSKLTLAKLVNALQSQEQRRKMRTEGYVEGALQPKLQTNQGEKNKWVSKTGMRATKNRSQNFIVD